MRTIKAYINQVAVATAGGFYILLGACAQSPAVAEKEVAPRTFSEFELVEKRNHREQLRTLKQLKSEQASGS